MHVAQESIAGNDMHQNKSLQRVAYIHFSATRFKSVNCPIGQVT